MKAQVTKRRLDNISNTEIFVDPENQAQEINVTAQDLTSWQKLHNEYKSSTASLKEKYGRLLSNQILSGADKDISSLANIFKIIAEKNIVLAEAANTNQSLKLYYYNDAAIACHHSLSVIKDANCNNNAELQELENEICRSLNDIQTAMVSFCGGRSELLQNINKKADLSSISKFEILKQLRDKTKEQLTAIEAAKANQNDSAYIELTANVFKEIAHGMEEYLATLYKEAEEILGPPPCDYTVIGLGSMALRQMTPYSDLECAILTANEGYKRPDNPAVVRDYFRNLSHLVHFKVINLGETIIPTSAYNINLATFIPQAVNFDLGGKTPLDRIEKDKPYELIQTVEEMLSYLRNEGNKTDHIDKNLTSILQKVCFIYGNGTLAKSYQDQAQKFLSNKSDNGSPNYESRAIKALLEGVEEIDYTKPTILQPKKIEGNLKQFSFNVYGEQGTLFDVKQEIYRMPDRFIYNLGLIYGIQEESSWDTIGKLCEQGIINPEGAANLKKALSFATNLRLKTYSHYGYQKDNMDFAKTYEMSQELTEIFKLAHEDLKEDGELFKYYYTALALKHSLEELCKLGNLRERKTEFFKDNIFYRNDTHTKAEINLRLIRYEAALNYQLEELKKLEARKQGLLDNSLDVTKIDLKIATHCYKTGNTYSDLGDYNSALEYHKKALNIRQQYLGDTHLDIANSLDKVGVTSRSLAKRIESAKETSKYIKEALSHHQDALEIRKSLKADPLEIANSLNNIGATYGALGNHNEALSYHQDSLEIRKSLKADPPKIANSLNNIGCIYRALKKYEKALKYLVEALEEREECLGKHHLHVANSVNSIGNVYRDLEHYDRALAYHEKALAVRRNFLGDNHPDITDYKRNISSTYCHLTMYQKALDELTDILGIYQNTNQKDKITRYNNDIARITMIKNLYEEAKQLLEDNTIVEIENHKETVKVISNLNTALNKFRKCSNFKKSNIIDEKILNTLELLIKAQTNLYQNSQPKTIGAQKQFNLYKKEYEDLKKSMDDKQLELKKIEEYLAAQKQARYKQGDIQLADDTLSIVENNSSSDDMLEKVDLVPLIGILNAESNEYNM